MSPRRSAQATPRAEQELRRVAVTFGVRVRDLRLGRAWSVANLAQRAGLSPDMVYRIEAGAPTSAQTAARLAVALERRLEIALVDHRRREGPNLAVDVIHSAMGELEAAHLRHRSFSVGLDEPYQHFQFAGRADLIAWDVNRRVFLHLENRTRFPDFQEMAGSFNAKRAYLGAAIAARVGVRRWASETHVLVALWTTEVVHPLRLRFASFEALCPDGSMPFERWWAGTPPEVGSTSCLVLLDPLAQGRQERFISLGRAMTSRPRYRGYAEVRALLQAA